MTLHSLRPSGLAVVVLVALATAAPIHAQERFKPLSFPSLSLAEPGAFGADFYVDDRDRDPQGIDVFDVGFRFRLQLGEKTGVFAHIVADRVVALPEAPAIPAAPRDLIFVGAARPIPNALVGEHPYVDKRGDARFDAFVPGIATIGVVRTLRRERVTVGVSGALNIPMTKSLDKLRSGSGSGSLDAVFAGLAAADVFGGRAHGQMGFTLAGKGAIPNQSFSTTGNSVEVTETDIGLGNRLDLGLAWIRPLSESLAAGIELRATKEFVGDQRIDAVSPVDVVLGLHKGFGRFQLSLALLNHFRALPSGERRANPLAGAIDLSDVAVAERNAFLTRAGLGNVTGQLREGVHTVLIGSSATALPAGAVRINPTYNIRSEHNLGYIVTLSFRR